VIAFLFATVFRDIRLTWSSRRLLGRLPGPSRRVRWGPFAAQVLHGHFVLSASDLIGPLGRVPLLGGYESGALKRLMGRHAVREDDLDVLLRGRVLVDLFSVLRQVVRVSDESYFGPPQTLIHASITAAGGSPLLGHAPGRPS
jgi:hypothetical protein